MLEDALKIADFTVTGGVLVFVLVMARQVLTAVVEWLPKFHQAVDAQSKAVVDLAEASKGAQELQEATLATLRAVSAETDRQSGELARAHQERAEILRLLKAQAGGEAMS